ncbi:hypothetical protein [Neolewinella agarilytica]|uniref:hypothetical protein n=1 Tax=Neolewinella agarilytica TaxID=478744 RepID=UPI001587C0A1|nr:hypothetical protein [Neolewinella agarilytica]
MEAKVHSHRRSPAPLTNSLHLRAVARIFSGTSTDVPENAGSGSFGNLFTRFRV